MPTTTAEFGDSQASLSLSSSKALLVWVPSFPACLQHFRVSEHLEGADHLSPILTLANKSLGNLTQPPSLSWTPSFSRRPYAITLASGYPEAHLIKFCLFPLLGTLTRIN